MAASTNPFSITGALSFPPDEGQPPVPVQLNLSGVFTQVAEEHAKTLQPVPWSTPGRAGAVTSTVAVEILAPATLKLAAG